MAEPERRKAKQEDRVDGRKLGTFLAKTIKGKVKDGTIYDKVEKAKKGTKDSAFWFQILLDLGTETDLRITWTRGAAAIAYHIMKGKGSVGMLVQLLCSTDVSFAALSPVCIMMRLQRNGAEYFIKVNGHDMDGKFDEGAPFTNPPLAQKQPQPQQPPPQQQPPQQPLAPRTPPVPEPQSRKRNADTVKRSTHNALGNRARKVAMAHNGTTKLTTSSLKEILKVLTEHRNAVKAPSQAEMTRITKRVRELEMELEVREIERVEAEELLEDTQALLDQARANRSISSPGEYEPSISRKPYGVMTRAIALRSLAKGQTASQARDYLLLYGAMEGWTRTPSIDTINSWRDDLHILADMISLFKLKTLKEAGNLQLVAHTDGSTVNRINSESETLQNITFGSMEGNVMLCLAAQSSKASATSKASMNDALKSWQVMLDAARAWANRPDTSAEDRAFIGTLFGDLMVVDIAGGVKGAVTDCGANDWALNSKCIPDLMASWTNVEKLERFVSFKCQLHLVSNLVNQIDKELRDAELATGILSKSIQDKEISDLIGSSYSQKTTSATFMFGYLANKLMGPAYMGLEGRRSEWTAFLVERAKEGKVGPLRNAEGVERPFYAADFCWTDTHGSRFDADCRNVVALWVAVQSGLLGEFMDFLRAQNKTNNLSNMIETKLVKSNAFYGLLQACALTLIRTIFPLDLKRLCVSNAWEHCDVLTYAVDQLEGPGSLGTASECPKMLESYIEGTHLIVKDAPPRTNQWWAASEWAARSASEAVASMVQSMTSRLAYRCRVYILDVRTEYLPGGELHDLSTSEDPEVVNVGLATKGSNVMSEAEFSVVKAHKLMMWSIKVENLEAIVKAKRNKLDETLFELITTRDWDTLKVILTLVDNFKPTWRMNVVEGRKKLRAEIDKRRQDAVEEQRKKDEAAGPLWKLDEVEGELAGMRTDAERSRSLREQIRRRAGERTREVMKGVDKGHKAETLAAMRTILGGLIARPLVNAPQVRSAAVVAQRKKESEDVAEKFTMVVKETNKAQASAGKTFKDPAALPEHDPRRKHRYHLMANGDDEVLKGAICSECGCCPPSEGEVCTVMCDSQKKDEVESKQCRKVFCLDCAGYKSKDDVPAHSWKCGCCIRDPALTWAIGSNIPKDAELKLVLAAWDRARKRGLRVKP